MNMRLWSLHPRYLDAKGLVALWREALLAKAVLSGKTKGYRNHPQLLRFRATPEPTAAIRSYLEAILNEARSRGYRFDARKLGRAHKGRTSPACLPVTRGQLDFEREHLLSKLLHRDLERYKLLRDDIAPQEHPLFRVIEGAVEEWEVAVAGKRQEKV